MKGKRQLAILALVLVAFGAGWVAHRVDLIGKTEAADETAKSSPTKAVRPRRLLPGQ